MLIQRTALFVCLAASLWGQVDRSNLTGTVTDSSAAVITNATIKLESAAIGLRREAITNDAGLFSLPALPIGSYTLTVSKQGFVTRRFDNLELSVGQSRVFNVTLDAAGTASEITVTAESAPLQQANAEIGVVVDQKLIGALPLNGRNWTSLLILSPGATNTGEGSQNTVRFNGRSRDDNNFTFDGVDATGVKDPRQEANLRLNISLDSIAEFRISSGLYNAESGNGAGAQVNLVSKSGTNDLHGGLFEYFRNDKLDARRPIDTLKPAFRLNQFGGNLGGRIIRDRTFYFVNYEGLEQRQGQTLNGSVPSAAFRAQVSATSPALRPVMEAIAVGNVRTADPNIDQLFVQASRPATEKSGLFKIDHRFSDRSSMFVRYNIDDGRLTDLQNALLETRISNFRTQNGAVQYQRVFSPTMLFELRLGVNRSALRRDTNGNFNEGISFPTFISLVPDRSEVEIGTSYGFVPAFTWNKGRHTFKFGGETRKIDLVLSDTGQITTQFTSLPNLTNNVVNSVSFASALPGLKGLRPYYFGYAQDEFKFRPNLTISYGIRYEYYTVAHTNDGRGRVFDLDRCQGFCPAGTPWYFPDRNNWAPRFGLAWSPKMLGGNTTFRLGYGIFYGPGQIDDVNAAIDSFPETFSLSSTDVPLSFPASRFIGQARSTGISARALQRDRRDGYNQSWTASIQQTLPWSFQLQATYVGGNGHKLFGRSFINTLDPVTRTRPYPNFSNIDIKWNNANSSNNALQLSLLRSARSGLQWQLQYMWSHNISDNAGAGDGQNLMISNCRRCDRASADWDIRHTATASSVYELPYGSTRRIKPSNAFLGAILGDWSLSGFYTVRTGLPFNVTIARNANTLPDGVATTPGRSAPAQRPDFVPGTSFYVDNKSTNLWLNAAAFRAPANLTWGNLPRNALRGPGLWQADLSLGKQARVTERFIAEFRAEMFNMFNRAQYGNPQANFSNLGTFGRFTSVVNSNPTGSGGPRQIQFMLRLRF
jgi:hypothetical protein